MNNRVRCARTGLSIVVALSAMASAGQLIAQGPSIGREALLEAVVAKRSAIEAGASLILPGGVYARTSLTVAAGLVNRDSGSAFVGRAEVLSRFLLDPFRESPFGLSVGGGVGVTNLVASRTWRPYLACAIDLELKRAGKVIPAVQLGLGGGARFGVILRSGSDRWR